MAQAKYGEQVALSCAKKLRELETDADARAFAETQIRDEARHLEYFTLAERELRVTRPVLPTLQQLFDTAERQVDLANVMLGTHLIVESLAHDLFADVAKRLLALSGIRWVPRAWRAALAEVARSMLGIARDESRHVAFGVLRLARLREGMNAEQRAHLDLLARHWYAQLAATLDALPVLFVLRPIKRQVAHAVLTRCRRRCVDAGLEVWS